MLHENPVEVECTNAPIGGITEDPPIECSFGFYLVDGKCTAIKVDEPVKCGEGFSVVDGECIAIKVDEPVKCGEGFSVVDGECIAIKVDEPVKCGEGFSVVDGECIAIKVDEPVKCGEGFSVVDGECIAIKVDEPVKCGEGFSVVDGKCTAFVVRADEPEPPIRLELIVSAMPKSVSGFRTFDPGIIVVASRPVDPGTADEPNYDAPILLVVTEGSLRLAASLSGDPSVIDLSFDSRRLDFLTDGPNKILAAMTCDQDGLGSWLIAVAKGREHPYILTDKGIEDVEYLAPPEMGEIECVVPGAVLTPTPTAIAILTPTPVTCGTGFELVDGECKENASDPTRKVTFEVGAIENPQVGQEFTVPFSWRSDRPASILISRFDQVLEADLVSPEYTTEYQGEQSFVCQTVGSARIEFILRAREEPNDENIIVYVDAGKHVREFTCLAPTTAPAPGSILVLESSDGPYDGTSANSSGGQLAVRYTAEAPSRAYVADVLIVDMPKAFELRLYGADQMAIADPIMAEPTMTGWFRLTFPTPIPVDGDFYASVFYTNDGAPVIGRDSSDPMARSWVVDSDGTWTPWSEKAQEFGLPDGEFAIKIWVTTK